MYCEFLIENVLWMTCFRIICTPSINTMHRAFVKPLTMLERQQQLLLYLCRTFSACFFFYFFFLYIFISLHAFGLHSSMQKEWFWILRRSRFVCADLHEEPTMAHKVLTHDIWSMILSLVINRSMKSQKKQLETVCISNITSCCTVGLAVVCTLSLF